METSGVNADLGARRGAVVLRARACSFGYDAARPVVREVSLDVLGGRVLVLAGPNGAGKSTLLKILAGLMGDAASSKVELGGRGMGAWSARERAERVAYVAQVPSVAFGFSAREVVGFGLPEGEAWDVDRGAGRAAVDAALEEVGLGGIEGKPFAHLSAGQQQRAALARALVRINFGREGGGLSELEGRVLLADEPTSAQDPFHAVRVVEVLRGLAARGAGVVLVMHDLSLALRAADDAALMSCDGRIAAAGAVSEVLHPERLAAVFGVAFAVAVSPMGGRALIAGEGTTDSMTGPLRSDAKVGMQVGTKESP
jgi:iron complex transport system ATP-binding protein